MDIYNNTKDRKGFFTQTSYDERGQSIVIPIMVKDKYTLYQRLKSQINNDSLI